MKNLFQIVSRNPKIALIMLAIGLMVSNLAVAQISLPGSDQFDKLTAAGDLLRIIDSALFKIGARILAGLAVLGAGWSLKEQRFGVAVIGIIAAIVIATTPMWVKNFFEIGGGSIFTP